jgi:hypothetical protein
MTIRKPFPTFKWRWLCLTPTEGLLKTEVFLGVLRALYKHQGEKPSSPNLISDLHNVAIDTRTKINLGRTPKRNLIRNSGQYWKGTGLLLPTKGLIELTNLGVDLAEGEISQSEFVALMITQTVLPNPYTFKPTELSNWNKHGLKIYPFQLILDIINELLIITKSNSFAYLTPKELIDVVIPLSGTKANANTIATWVINYRENPLVVATWEKCAIVSNDKRFAKEFLMFLSNFGVCSKVDSSDEYTEKYFLEDGFFSSFAGSHASIFRSDSERKDALDEIRHSDLPSMIDRKRTAATYYRRSGQDKFRKDILNAYSSRCILTGESIQNVLEAAHIIPVEKSGADHINNGLCLRVDVHRLFDLGGIKINKTGDVALSHQILSSKTYNALPKKVSLPHFVNPANIQWRQTYM